MKHDKSESGYFKTLLPVGQEWFTPKEVAAILGRSPQYVRDAFDNQKILGHVLNGRAKKGKERRRSYQVHRDCVLLFLAETANYEASDFVRRAWRLIEKSAQPQDLRAIGERIRKLTA